MWPKKQNKKSNVNISLTQHKRETHAVIEAWNTHGICASVSAVRVCMFQQHEVEVMET